MIRVTAYTAGRNVPSARFRVRQYVPALARYGVAVKEFPAPFGSYPPSQRWLRPLWGFASLAANIPRAARSWSRDVCLLQREFLSTFVTLEHLTKKPRILDVDDAVYLYRDGHAARALAIMVDRIICGNASLAQWFRRWNSNVEVIPTPIDTGLYLPTARTGSDSTVIGWSGTSSNFPHLESIESALLRVLTTIPAARLRIVSDRRPSLRSIPKDRVEFVRWTQENEVSDIQSMDIGIMPLQDSEWARGKCSFKMIQYMACGLPVVVSPVGMNVDVLRLGRCGIAASAQNEWVDSLVSLLESPKLRVSLGMEGRHITEAHFSLEVLAPKLARYLGGDRI